MPSPTDGWLRAGLASSFPNVAPKPASRSAEKKASLHTAAANTDEQPACKILKPHYTEGVATACELTSDEAQETIGVEPQVLVFRYGNKIIAIDHCCPHRNYPLSRGSVYDIEDFGIVLSAGITCPGHGWAFDLYTGLSDRGTYKLGVWETMTVESDGGEEEVWVRRKTT
jgi:nitrite reductase/ring-hydroxylating ferredoxin subunit